MTAAHSGDHLDAGRNAPQGVGAWPRWLLCLLPILFWALAGAPGHARAGAVPGELPAFVGRLSTLQGDVRWYDRDSAGWLGTPEQPLRNWPLAAGDRLRTGSNGRAELRIGSSTLRLGSDVDLTLLHLDEQSLVLLLQSGTLALRLADPVAGDSTRVELQTTEGRWWPRQPGHYRFDRQAHTRTPATLATPWRGELRFEGRDSVLAIPAGRRAEIWLDPAVGNTRYSWAEVERDEFADWVAREERLDDAPVSARHVPPGMTGWQDLDRHGDWIEHPDLGTVWQPRSVAPGWAPFHDGRWAWVAPWGWTWIDAAPWGFAPFHYGSWLMWQGRWCWSPGPRQQRPRYTPAHSAWVGPSLSIGIQIGSRPPPPRVVVPIVVLPPHRPVRPEPGRPPAPAQREPDRHDRPEPGARPDRDHRQDRRDSERRDEPRRDPDGRDTGRRDAAPRAPAPLMPGVPGAVTGPVRTPGPAALPASPVPAPGPSVGPQRPDRGGAPPPAQPTQAPAAAVPMGPAAPAQRPPTAGPGAAPAAPAAAVAPVARPPRPAREPEARPAAPEVQADRRPPEPQRPEPPQRPDKPQRPERNERVP